jgi:hypothetical protein
MLRSLCAGGIAVLLLGALVLGSCTCNSGGAGTCAPPVVTTTQSCQTTGDCVSAGFRSLSCVNGKCLRPCTIDDDCSISQLVGEQCKSQLLGTLPTFVCESELCTSGCSMDKDCTNPGETCNAGRCQIYHESFEIRMGQDTITLQSIGWDEFKYPLQNNRTAILYSGIMSCQLGDPQCAGAAADGLRFLALQTVPTGPIGEADTFSSTCRACACCVQCRLAPSTFDPTMCPVDTFQPDDYACPAQIPGSCSAVCGQCDQCSAAKTTDASCNLTPLNIGANSGLLECEQQAAGKGCSSCPTSDQCLCQQLAMMQGTPSACSDQGNPCHSTSVNACKQCLAQNACMMQSQPCEACRTDAMCKANNDQSAECLMAAQTCMTQGTDGCFTTPTHRIDTQFDDCEEATISSTVSLDGISGNLLLEFQYVPFNVGDDYIQVQQGQPRASWMRIKQEVLAQLCAADCGKAASWSDAMLTSGDKASIPPAGQRNNGLHLGNQTVVDWSSNHVSIPIPDAMHTKTFHFRFVPRLDDGVIVAIDNIVIRRAP